MSIPLLYADLAKSKRPKGIVWIGDPHLSSVKPGRRIGTNEDHQERILGKFEKGISLANDQQYQVIITGDLFDRAKEANLGFLIRIIEVLKTSKYPVLCLGGNHDSSETGYDNHSALHLLHTAGVLSVMSTQGFYAGISLSSGQTWGLYAIPFSVSMEQLPTEIEPSEMIFDKVIATSHLDLNFEQYPGVIPMAEIKGIDIVVNGHIHKSHEPITHGQTTFYNPGNINRLSVDTKDHKPQILAMSQYLEPSMVVLPHETGEQAFDLTGRMIIRNPLSDKLGSIGVLKESSLSKGSSPTVDKVAELLEKNMTDSADPVKNWLRELINKLPKEA